MARAARTATPVAIRKEFKDLVSKLPSQEMVKDDYALQDNTDDEWDMDVKGNHGVGVGYADASVQVNIDGVKEEVGG